MPVFLENLVALAIPLLLLWAISRLIAVPFWARFIDPEGSKDVEGELSAVLCIPLFFVINWAMAISKWFMTDHSSFWQGFKELVWALIPLLNIGYVLDWWTLAAYGLYVELLWFDSL